MGQHAFTQHAGQGALWQDLVWLLQRILGGSLAVSEHCLCAELVSAWMLFTGVLARACAILRFGLLHAPRCSIRCLHSGYSAAAQHRWASMPPRGLCVLAPARNISHLSVRLRCSLQRTGGKLPGLRCCLGCATLCRLRGCRARCVHWVARWHCTGSACAAPCM